MSKKASCYKAAQKRSKSPISLTYGLFMAENTFQAIHTIHFLPAKLNNHGRITRIEQSMQKLVVVRFPSAYLPCAHFHNIYSLPSESSTFPIIRTAPDYWNHPWLSELIVCYLICLATPEYINGTKILESNKSFIKDRRPQYPAEAQEDRKQWLLAEISKIETRVDNGTEEILDSMEVFIQKGSFKFPIQSPEARKKWFLEQIINIKAVDPKQENEAEKKEWSDDII